MTCPFCDADRPELVSQFGSQLLLSQYRCRACGTYFEGLRDTPEGDPAEGPQTRVGLPLSVSAERAQRAVTEEPQP